VFFVFLEAERLFAVIRHGRVRIADARQIRRARLCQQIAEHGIIPLLRLEPGYAAVRVADVAEHNRLRRARLLARGLRNRAGGLP